MLTQPETAAQLDFHVLDTDIRLHAPQTVLDVFERMFAQIPRRWSARFDPAQVTVSFVADIWQICGSMPAAQKTLAGTSSVPQVAGAAVACVLAEVAGRRNLSLWRAAVVAHEGSALALVGDDWESAITLAAHLHARGWQLVSGDYALVDLPTSSVRGFRKLLHVNALGLGWFPGVYRAAIEASAWYASKDTISFYAVDPTLVNGNAAWSGGALLRAVLKLDGRIGERPSLEYCEDFAMTETLRRSDLHHPVEAAMLVLGTFIETADFLERWFGALPAR